MTTVNSDVSPTNSILPKRDTLTSSSGNNLKGNVYITQMLSLSLSLLHTMILYIPDMLHGWQLSSFPVYTWTHCCPLRGTSVHGSLQILLVLCHSCDGLHIDMVHILGGKISAGIYHIINYLYTFTNKWSYFDACLVNKIVLEYILVWGQDNWYFSCQSVKIKANTKHCILLKLC